MLFPVLSIQRSLLGLGPVGSQADVEEGFHVLALHSLMLFSISPHRVHKVLWAPQDLLEPVGLQ